QPPAPRRPAEREDSVRARYGFTFFAGAAVPVRATASPGGGFAGLALRLGLQLTHTFALYYQGTGVLGLLSVDAGGGATRLTWFSDLANSVLLSFTFADKVELALGGSASRLGPLGYEPAAPSGWGFGPHARLA